MRLTPHFRLEEFTHSDTAIAAGIPNRPTDEALRNLFALATFLEQVRRLLHNSAITVHSGYRNAEVNKLVGGTRYSAHTLGYAADISVQGMSSFRVAVELASSRLTFDQLIHEPSRDIVHLSIDPRLRRDILTQHGGPGTQLVRGIGKGKA